jgi:hypothetical protein
MENQIMQQHLDLDADRTSTHGMASNQLRLWFSAFCSVALPETTNFGLAGHRIGSCDCRHDPTTIAQDRRPDHGQHAPGLHFGSLRHFRFRTSSHKHIVLWQGRYPKRVNFTTSPLHHCQWIATGQQAEPARNRSKFGRPRRP